MTEEKAKVINEYTEGKLNMAGDIGPFNEDPKYKAAVVRPKASPLGIRLCGYKNHNEDHEGLAEDCMHHHCNKFCLDKKKTVTITIICRVTCGTESVRGNTDTSGFMMRDTATIVADGKKYQTLSNEMDEVISTCATQLDTSSRLA